MAGEPFGWKQVQQHAGEFAVRNTKREHPPLLQQPIKASWESRAVSDVESCWLLKMDN
jgi:hypothetical protein